MNGCTAIILFIGCLTPAIHAHKWTTLKAKWSHIPLLRSDYVDLVKGENFDKDKWEIARDKGWDLHALWNAKVYCFTYDPSICSLYDVNDHIIGLQIGFPVSSVDAIGSPLRLNEKKYARKINRLGYDVYVLTLFFVDPAADVFAEGRKEWTGSVGDGLWIVDWDGEDYSFSKIPTSLDEMAPAGYSKHSCVAGMGTHYFKNLDYSTPCSNLYPVFLTFDEEKPIGFGVQTLGYPLFNKYSKWNEVSIAYPSLAKETPTCLRWGSLYPGMIVTHFYFTPDPKLIKCSE